MGRPKRTLKRSVRLEPLESVAKKVKNELFNDFNPWSVDDLSFFLKYCCPECNFSDQALKNFTEHALEKHSKSKSFFTPYDVAEECHWT